MDQRAITVDGSKNGNLEPAGRLNLPMLTRRRFLAQSAAGAFALPLLSSETQNHGVVDSHVHVFERNPRFPLAPGALPPAEDAPPEALINLMRSNGVARTVIIQVIHY